MLRAVPSFFATQIWGVIVMFGAVVVLFFLPWLDRSPVKSWRYKGPIFFWATILFAIDFGMLNYLGMHKPNPTFTLMARFGTVYYFAYFLLVLPFSHKFDKTKPVPERVTS